MAAAALGLAAGLAAATPTPAEAIARLKTGNAVFVAHPEEALPISVDGRSALTAGQTPFASVLSCADARVPPEVIFHAGLGDLFVVRSAGHVTDRSMLASLEYAARELQVPLIVVMGHESCGTVKAAMDAAATPAPGGPNTGSPNMEYLLKALRPAVAATASEPDATRLRAAVLRNVEDTINDLMDDSAVLRGLAETGAMGMVGAYYELSTGRVYFSEPVTVTLQAKAGSAAR
jgi:carbonic anhydrase